MIGDITPLEEAQPKLPQHSAHQDTSWKTVSPTIIDELHMLCLSAKARRECCST